MKAFRVQGYFKQNRKANKFTKDVLAEKEAEAIRKVQLDFGSKNRIKRDQIKIESVSEIKAEDSKNPLVQALVK